MRKSLRHPFFLPALRRHLTVAFLALWTLFEGLVGGPGWALGIGALTLFCVYEFYIVFEPANYEAKDG